MPILAITTKLKQSLGQLEGFKSYNGIYKRKQYSKAALANMDGVEDYIVELQVIVKPYLLKDVYNMDKIGLFQKAILDTTLATKALLGIKKQKV